MSWPVVGITDVARVVGGATPKSGTEEYWNGDILWTTPKDLTNLDGKFLSDTPRKITEQGLKSCSAEVLPANSVLFSSRAPIGHVAINSVPIATNQGFKSFVPTEHIDASFLYWWLDANRSHLQSMGTGATFKEVSKAAVERIKIPLPPLEEQKRIAGILDQADALRRLRTRALDKLNTLGQAIFHEMFGEVDASVRNWPTLSLADLVFDDDRVNYGVVQPGDHAPDGVPIIRVADLSAPVMDFASVKRISKDIDANYARSRLKGGEILIGCVGSIGTAMIAPKEFKGANIARAVARIAVDPKKCNPEFVAEYVRSDLVQRYFQKEVRLVAQPTLNIKQIRETKIVVPPADLQAIFLERLNVIMENKKKAAKSYVKQQALFTSLQHCAFRGEL